MFALDSYHSQILKRTPDWVKIIQKVWVRFINVNNSATSYFVKLILQGSRVNALLNYINPERPTTSSSSVSGGFSCAQQIVTTSIFRKCQQRVIMCSANCNHLYLSIVSAEGYQVLSKLQLCLSKFLFGIDGIPKRQEGSRSQLNCLELWQLVCPFTLHRSGRSNQRLWICFTSIVAQAIQLWITSARNPTDLFRF